MTKGWPGRLILTFLVVVALGAAWLGFQALSPIPTAKLSNAVSPAAAAPASQTISIGDFSGAIRHVAETVKPAIVQITSTQQGLGGFNQPVPQQTGVGSGVIYDGQGHILTNNHVVEGAQTLTVALPDGRSYDAKVVGTDPQTDLAVVQIQADNLPVAQMGDSGQIGVGDWVVAIGNALALSGGPTVTAGVVSATGRTVQEPGSSGSQAGPFLYDLIQTDAAINPGNSGGALVNLNGQVVGINTLVAGTAEPGVQAQGIGFAISINSARPIADQLVSTGKAVHPFIGINYAGLTPSMARQFNLPSNTKGIVVAQVVPGSPGAQAGLQQGDVITQVGDQPITDESTLGRYLITRKPGDALTLTIQRGGQSQQITVTLGTRPAGQ